jgi:hypothetical protein
MAAVTMMKMRVFKEANVSLSMSRVEQSDRCGPARYQSRVDLSARCYLTVFQPPNAVNLDCAIFIFYRFILDTKTKTGSIRSLVCLLLLH